MPPGKLPIKIYQIESQNPDAKSRVAIALARFNGKKMEFSLCYKKIQTLQKKLAKQLPLNILLNIETIAWNSEIAVDAYIFVKKADIPIRLKKKTHP